jgi:hypothetical protein
MFALYDFCDLATSSEVLALQSWRVLRPGYPLDRSSGGPSGEERAAFPPAVLCYTSCFTQDN